MSAALKWSLIVALGLVPMSVHFTMLRYAGDSYYLEFFARWLVSGIIFGAVTYAIIRSVSAVKPAISKSSLNEDFADVNKNPVSHIDRTHDKFYEIAWDEIESGNKDKAVWAKAFSLANGAEDKVRAIYISLRVSMLGEGQESTEPRPPNVKVSESAGVGPGKLESGNNVVVIVVVVVIYFSILFLFFSI